LIICCFASHPGIFHLYGDITITGEGLQNLGLCSALRAFDQGGHTCCDTGPLFFRSHPKDRPILSPLMTHKGMRRIYSNPDPQDIIDIYSMYVWLKDTANFFYRVIVSEQILLNRDIRISLPIKGYN
jgi:hypothetical protein